VHVEFDQIEANNMENSFVCLVSKKDPIGVK
jgi:hypothetical protein